MKTPNLADREKIIESPGVERDYTIIGLCECENLLGVAICLIGLWVNLSLFPKSDSCCQTFSEIRS